MMDKKRYDYAITNKIYIKKFDSIIKNDIIDAGWLSSKYVVNYKNLKKLKTSIKFNIYKNPIYVYIDGFDFGFDKLKVK